MAHEPAVGVEEIGRHPQRPFSPDGTGSTPVPHHHSSYLKACQDQFVNIIMIATFAGGVQASILSFLNDLLSADSVRAELFRKNPTDLYRPRYTVYSLGLMIGLFAIAGNIGVAATAAANAALLCQYSISNPTFQPRVEARALFCMLALFIAFILSGCSLILLSIEFDPSFAIFIALVLIGGLVVAAYQPAVRYGGEWRKAVRDKPLHICSMVVSTAAFAITLARPVQSAWYAGSGYGATCIYHIMAVLFGESAEGEKGTPRRLAAFGATLLALGWAGCIVVTFAWKFNLGRVDQVLSYVVAAVSGVEAMLLGAIAARDWFAIAKATRKAVVNTGPEGGEDPQRDTAETGGSQVG
ncbi:hypothetical protein FA13DRAFT_1791394 [Coprinellus micaceus]|uniref:Uncharacterized protein n=1 Tax=Coprinellus micaceus TaxID=71717 RepID=A0A4Y7TBR5_COPMI|nr:hypothetical protein FA13DRAFT_1791394 [Coprinellus micaceus]